MEITNKKTNSAIIKTEISPLAKNGPAAALRSEPRAACLAQLAP